MTHQHATDPIPQFEFWKNELTDAPNLIQIPTDYSRSQNQLFDGKEHRFSIESQLMNKLADLEKNMDSDRQIILLTAFGVLLYRYSSQDHFVVGVSFVSRRKDDLDSKTAGLIDKFPIRFLFQEDASFADVLGIIKSKTKVVFENHEIFNEQLMLNLTGQETLDLSPFFNVLFDFQTNSKKISDHAGDQLKRLNEKQTITGFDFALHIVEEDDSFECILTYNQNLFSEGTIKRLGGHFNTLLTAITENADLPVQKLPLLTVKEEKLMLDEWNDTKVDYPKDKCIHHLFEKQVDKMPDAIAAVYENEQITYAELNSSANRLANYLSRQGACEDQSVALFVERGLDMIIGLLAISKTGATYLPLDPIYPQARLSLIVDDAKPVIILTQRSLINSIPETTGKIIFVDDRSAYSEEPSGNLLFGNPQKPAYILYTSGSTGKPKGVQITQFAVVNLVNSMSKLLDFTAQDILLAVTTISFDIAELEMFMPLFKGAKLVIATQETATDMELLSEKIEECGATLFQATPVTFKMLMINSWKGKKDLKTIIGGEALSKELVRELLPRVREVWNSYGPTETAIYSVTRNLTIEDTVGEGYVPIGRPIDNTTLYVLNKKMIPVPIGIAGELYIGGDGVSPGYLNLPNVTDERFIPNPFGDIPEEKIYKTGDLVQYFPDGNLVFLNRVDTQVKIRGFRIELGEIESAIAQFGAIKDNVVIVREDNPGDKKLVAYIVLKENKELDPAALRKFLATKLPEYMIPATIVKMDQFPTTLNGKVDRKVLPAPDDIISQVSAKHVAPASETEKKLTTIWSDILKIENIGITDNFFELGGNSLVAAMMISRINKIFDIRLSLRVLFKEQTIKEIAKEIETQKSFDKYL